MRKTKAASFCSSAKIVSTVQDKAIVIVRRDLAAWITNCENESICLDSTVIWEKARSLYHQFAVDGYVKEKEATEDQMAGLSKGFHGSKGWFTIFKNGLS